MNYCESCRCVTSAPVCPVCASGDLRPVQGADFCLLTEQEEMWAKLLMEVLENNHIPFARFPVWGAGLALKSGRAERCQVFVPFEKLEEASDLLTILFPR